MKCIDLFSGCGGMSQGFIEAGYNVMAAIDNWKPAIAVYKHNFKHPIYEQDLRRIKKSVILIKELMPEIIIGGPPCQDFSSAGKRDEKLGRADLTYSFANIISQVRPKWFVMENVERIKKSKILKDVVKQLNSEGYGLTGIILDASYCGVPQKRLRFFLIGEKDGCNNTLLQNFMQSLSDTPMTIREYLGDELGLKYYYRHPRNYNRRGVFSIDEPSPTVRGVNRPVPKGYKLHNADPKGVSLKQIRHLTTLERSYLQTFPKNFIFEGTKTNLEQMIGNAVPVNMAKFVATVIKNYIEDGALQSQYTFFQEEQLFRYPQKPLQKEVELLV